MSGTIDPSPEGKLLMTTAPIYPQADPWTVDDLDRLPDGYFYEIVDGSLLVSPPAVPFHDRAGMRLAVDIGFPVTLRPAELTQRRKPRR